MPETVDETQEIYNELNRRGVFKANSEAQQIGHELRRRGVVTDATQGGLVNGTPSQASSSPGMAQRYAQQGAISYVSPQQQKLQKQFASSNASTAPITTEALPSSGKSFIPKSKGRAMTNAEQDTAEKQRQEIEGGNAFYTKSQLAALPHTLTGNLKRNLSGFVTPENIATMGALAFAPELGPLGVAASRAAGLYYGAQGVAGGIKEGQKYGIGAGVGAALPFVLPAVIGKAGEAMKPKDVAAPDATAPEAGSSAATPPAARPIVPAEQGTSRPPFVGTPTPEVKPPFKLPETKPEAQTTVKPNLFREGDLIKDISGKRFHVIDIGTAKDGSPIITYANAKYSYTGDPNDFQHVAEPTFKPGLELWQVPQPEVDRRLFYGDQQSAISQVHGDVSIDKPGDVRYYFRYGDVPPGGRSMNHATHEQEEGVSAYPTAGSEGLGADMGRPQYYGKGQLVGYGSDNEPLIIPKGKWRIYPGHEAIVKKALAEGKPVPPEVLADYPDLKPKGVKPDATIQKEQVQGTRTNDVRAGETGQTSAGRGGRKSKSDTEVVQQTAPARQEPGQSKEVVKPLTGAKNAITEEERLARGMPEVNRQAYTGIAESANIGRKAVDAGEIDPKGLARSVAEEPRPLNEKEVGALAFDRARITLEHQDATKKLAAAVDAGDKNAIAEQRARLNLAEEHFDYNDQALVKGGRAQSAAFNARKMILNSDYSTAAVTQRLKGANPERPVSEIETKRISDNAVKLAEAEAKIAEHEKSIGGLQDQTSVLQDRIKQLEADRSVRQDISKEAKVKRAATKAALETEFEDLKQQAARILQKQTINVGPQQLVELAPVAGKMLANLAKRNIGLKAQDAVSMIHDALKDFADNLTERHVRDMLSGYGDVKKGTANPTELQIAQMKRSMRLISQIEDVQGGKKPLRSGFQPAPDTEAVAGLRAELDVALKQAGMNQAWSMTPEQRIAATKSRLKVRIDELNRRIKEGDFSKPAKRPPLTTPELTKLREQKDSLQKKYDAARGPQKFEPTLQMKQNSYTAMLKARIAELDARIKGNNFTRPQTTPIPLTEAMKQLKSQRDKLQAQYDAIKPPRVMPESQKMAAVKSRLTKQIADYENRLKTGNLDTPKRSKLNYDEEGQKLRDNRDKLRYEIDKQIALRQKMHPGDFVTRWQRLNVLSNPATAGKLVMAALSRIAVTPIEDAFGVVPRTLARSVADIAPIEGSTAGIKGNVEGLKAVFSKQTLLDMKQKLKTGANSLDLRNQKTGKVEIYHPFLDFFGSVHGALKTPAQRFAFYRALENYGQTAAKAGKDLRDPAVQMEAGAHAYAESKRAILQGDNLVTDIFSNFVGYAERQGPGGKAIATAAKVLTPIVKVPTNYIAEASNYIAGGPIGVGKLIAAKMRGELKPEETDAVMRAFKKQGVGAGLLALGYMKPNAIQAGGYYGRGQKEENGLKFGEVKVFGVKIPHVLLHSPAIEALQFGRTWRRAMDQTKGKDTGDRIGAAAYQSSMGMAEQVPFIDEPVRMARATESAKGIGVKAGEITSSVLVPQIVQAGARGQLPGQRFTPFKGDVNAKGETIKRTPRGFRDTLRVATGIQRKQVPVSGQKQSATKEEDFFANPAKKRKNSADSWFSIKADKF